MLLCSTRTERKRSPDDLWRSTTFARIDFIAGVLIDFHKILALFSTSQWGCGQTEFDSVKVELKAIVWDHLIASSFDTFVLYVCDSVSLLTSPDQKKKRANDPLSAEAGKSSAK